MTAPVGWLLRDDVLVDGYGDAARVADERARRQRAAVADRLANATLAEGDPGIAELLEWAKLGLSAETTAWPAARSAAAWLAWWDQRGCRAAVPRDAHAAVLHALLGLTQTGDGTAQLAPRLPPSWPAWRLERWRLGRSVLDAGVERRGDLVRCVLSPRHGPAPVLTVMPGTAAGAMMLVDGDPIRADTVHLELRGRVTLEWDPA